MDSFERYLRLNGYAESTINQTIAYTEDFLNWKEKQEIEPDKILINNYLEHLQTRKNARKNGALSQNSIIGNLNALKRYAKYLQLTEKQTFEIDFLNYPFCFGLHNLN